MKKRKKQIYFYLSQTHPVLLPPTESTQESFPVKIWPVKPLLIEKSLNFPLLRFILHNLVHPSGNVK